MRVNKKFLISSLEKQHAYIQGIILILNGFIAHEIAHNGNLSMAYVMIVFPRAEEETGRIRVTATARLVGGKQKCMCECVHVCV